MIAAITGGVLLWQRLGGGTAAADDEPVESEPNDVPAEADDLPVGRAMSGYLGRRSGVEQSDADLWALREPEGEHARGPRVVRIELGGLPNMDTVLEIFRAGQSEPLLVADSTGVGGAERVPNFVIGEGSYLVRVREVWETGRHATENVSDAYALRWDVVEPPAGDEREVNDSFALAERVLVGEERRGFVGWSGDVDVLCLAEDAPAVSAILEPVASLDLVLRVEERHLGREVAYDSGRAGQGEESAPGAGVAGQTCFHVSVAPGSAVTSDAEARWALRVVPVAAGPP